MASTTIASPTKSALVLGATGAVGGPLLAALLAAPEYSRVREAGRRVTSADALPAGAAASGKLEQRIVDYEKMLAGDREGLDEAPWDVVFITIGTTRAQAGSAAAFAKIDREYVVAAAKAAKSADPAHSQRVVYCSSKSASPKSFLLYPKTKGLTELDIAALGYSETLVVRPGFFAGRPGERTGEAILAPFLKSLSYTPLGRNMRIHVSEVARAILRVGTLGAGALLASAHAFETGESGNQFTVVGNAGLLALAEGA